MSLMTSINEVRKTLKRLRQLLDAERYYLSRKDIQTAESYLDKAEWNLLDAEFALNTGIIVLVGDAIKEAVTAIDKFLNIFGGVYGDSYC